MGGPNRILAGGKSCRTAVASTCAEECRNTSSAWGCLSVRISTATPSDSGRARSRTSPFTFAASAALASPGPIALARSAAVAPEGRTFWLPSGSVTRISAAGIDQRLAGGGGAAPPVPAARGPREWGGTHAAPKKRDRAGEAGRGGGQHPHQRRR